MNRLFTFFCLSLLLSTAQAQLPNPEYHKEKATLSGKIANYKPDANLGFKIGAPNVLMGAAETLYPTIEPDGSFNISVPVYHDTQVRMMLANKDIVFLVSPGKETSLTINLDNPQGKQFIFDGQYATINNEWCQPELKTKIPPVYRDGNMLDSIVGLSPIEFKKRCISIQPIRCTQQLTDTIQRRYPYISQFVVCFRLPTQFTGHSILSANCLSKKRKHYTRKSICRFL